MANPFDGWSPAAANRDGAEWALARMRGREGVAAVVPDGFDATARIMRGLHTENEPLTTWAAAAPEYLDRSASYSYPYPWGDTINVFEGNLDASIVDALVPMLAAATATPATSHAAVWIGWGWLQAGGSRTMTYWPIGSVPTPEDRARSERARRTWESAQADVHSFVARCPVAPWWGGRDRC